MKNGLIEARFLFAPSGFSEFARCEAGVFVFMRWSPRHSERHLKLSERCTIIYEGAARAVLDAAIGLLELAAGPSAHCNMVATASDA